MQKIGSITSTATPDGSFTNGSVASGVSPTILDAAWFNTVQNELVALVLTGGLTLDPKNDAQVLAALKNLFLQRSSPFADIAADGAQAITTALNNLGLGAGSALPVGVPIPWPLSTPPTSYLKCNGASFNGTTYPGLAKAYPSLVLPDLRGEFIRGWDDGRGVDTGRALLSLQGFAMQPIQARFAIPASTYSGVISRESQSAAWMQIGSNTANDLWNMYFNSAATTQTASETRPRNVAFNYIVRAA